MTPIHRTFTVPIEDIGTFTFRRRDMGDQLRIQAAYNTLAAGITDVAGLAAAEALATLPVLTVSAPPGWNLDELDPLDPEAWKKLGLVFGGLRKAEDDFRAGGAPKREGVGQAPGGNA